MIRIAVATVVLLVGCAGSASLSGIAPSASEYGTVIRWWNLKQMIPTTMHAYIYRMMGECAGVEGDFWAIRWFSADFNLDHDDPRFEQCELKHIVPVEPR